MSTSVTTPTLVRIYKSFLNDAKEARESENYQTMVSSVVSAIGVGRHFKSDEEIELEVKEYLLEAGAFFKTESLSSLTLLKPMGIFSFYYDLYRVSK